MTSANHYPYIPEAELITTIGKGDPPRKRKAPPAANWQGRFSTNELRVIYHVGRILQSPFAAVFWILDGGLARLDAEILRRNGGV